MTNQPDRQQHSKRPYTKPQVTQVPLRPDEAVLGFCKIGSASGPGAPGNCNPGGGTCSTAGS
jgi:hypothetical protein